MDQAPEMIAGFTAALVTTIIVIPWLIPKLKQRGMVGRDLNKPEKPLVAEMGGIAVVIGFSSGVGLLAATDNVTNMALLYVSLSAAIGAAFVGIMDDIFELRHRQKAFLPFLLALPLGATLEESIFLPYIGTLELGPLMVIAAPFAVTCAANAGNMLEGFNGLGTGLGVIMATSLTILAFHHHRLDGAYVLVPLTGALVAFLWFNRYPAKVFPGDTLMLFMGAAIAVGGMLSNLYVQTTVIFLPMIVEFFMKLRGRFGAENYSSDTSDGYLHYEGKVESLTHVLMKSFRLREASLVYSLWGIEAILCAIVIIADFGL